MIPVYLLLVLAVSFIGAFTDIRTGRVFAVGEYFLAHSSSIPIFPLTVNVILAVMTAIIFYLTDIWAPGDCKLYIVISLIFPMSAYVVRKGNIFPALNFVIYAFALGYIFLLAAALIHKPEAKLPNFTLQHVPSVLANTGTISLLNVLINTCAPEFFYANQVLCILSSAALILVLQRKADKARRVIGFVGLLYILLGSWSAAFMTLALSLVTASAIEFISTRARANTYREISGDEVCPGMILSFVSVLAMMKSTAPDLPKTTTENRRTRLTQRQADAVKTWCRNSHSNIVIVEMMPFAPFLAGGVVIEILRFLLLVR